MVFSSIVVFWQLGLLHIRYWYLLFTNLLTMAFPHKLQYRIPANGFFNEVLFTGV